MIKLTDKIQISRTYDTSIMLMSISDTVCPEFLSHELQQLIAKCFEALPNKISFTLLEDE